MDSLTKEKRSWNMSRVCSRNTTPEKQVRSLLHKAGFRFRIHVKNLPGTPDIVLPKYKTIIFVHGCFWHRHAGCKFAYHPKSNQDFWENKFKATIARDQKKTDKLLSAGWQVLVIWECELAKKPQELLQRINQKFKREINAT